MIDDITQKFEADRLERQLQAKREELEKYTLELQTVFDLKGRIDNLGNQKANIQKEIEELSSIRASKQNELELLILKVAKLTDEVGVANRNLNETARKTDQVKMLGERHLGEVDSHKEEKEKIAKEIQSQKTELQQVTTELTQLKNQVPGARRESEEIISHIANEKTKLSELLNLVALEEDRYKKTLEQSLELQGKVTLLGVEAKRLYDENEAAKQKTEKHYEKWEEKLKARDEELTIRADDLKTSEYQLGQKVLTVRKAKLNFETASGKKLDIVI